MTTILPSSPALNSRGTVCLKLPRYSETPETISQAYYVKQRFILLMLSAITDIYRPLSFQATRAIYFRRLWERHAWSVDVPGRPYREVPVCCCA